MLVPQLKYKPKTVIPQPFSKKRRRMSFIDWFIILFLLVFISWGVYRVFFYSSSKAKSSSSQNQNLSNSSREIRLIATGDWIAHTSVDTAALQPNGTYDYMPLINDFLPIFSHANIRFCNDPILNGGSSLGIYGYPKFNSPTSFVTDMGKLGCNLANLASNHSFDFTQANIDNSVSAWQKVPNVLAFAGENQNQLQHDAVRYFSEDGIKFAFLAYTSYLNTDAPAQNSYGVNVFSTTFASSQIASAKQDGAKFIIVSMRWGTEYSSTITAEQTQDAQWLADQGVNLILGHGTHVLQPVAWLNGLNGSRTLVWYGLGDFLQSQIPADTVFNGIAVLDIDPDTLTIDKLGFIPIYMHYDWSASQAAAQDLAARTNLHLYLLEDATQNMINAQQLNTSVDQQKQRLSSTLSADGLSIPLITSKQYLEQY